MLLNNITAINTHTRVHTYEGMQHAYTHMYIHILLWQKNSVRHNMPLNNNIIITEVCIKHKILSVETILSAYMHVHVCTHTRTHRHLHT